MFFTLSVSFHTSSKGVQMYHYPYTHTLYLRPTQFTSYSKRVATKCRACHTHMKTAARHDCGMPYNNSSLCYQMHKHQS